MKNLFTSKNYEDMSRKELTDVARRRGLDLRLLTFKGEEGAWERDRIVIIRQLNTLDQQKREEERWFQTWWGKALIALAVTVVGGAIVVLLFGG